MRKVPSKIKFLTEYASGRSEIVEVEKRDIINTHRGYERLRLAGVVKSFRVVVFEQNVAAHCQTHGISAEMVVAK